MRRFLHAAHAVWRAVVLAGLLAWLVGVSTPVQAQTLDPVWATSAGGRGYDAGTHIAVDGAGNSYVTGYFSRTATFGSGEQETTFQDHPEDTSEEMFVAKYDGSGQLVWVTATYTRGADKTRSTGLAVDRAGNLYVTGRFSGVVTFGPGEVYQTTLTKRRRETRDDLFIAQYDRNGRLRWVRQIEGFGLVEEDAGITGIAVDAAGNSYVTGHFDGLLTFGMGEASQRILSSWPKGGGGCASYLRECFAIFIAKYDRDGRLGWARLINSGFSRYDSRGIAVDGVGNSYITGRFTGTATFGSGDAHETTLTSVDRTFFVATYDSDGRLRWVTHADGGLSHVYAGVAGVVVDGAGNSYVTGFFHGTMTFGAGEVQETTLTYTVRNSASPYMAAYDGDGRLRWVRQEGGGRLALDRAGDIFVMRGSHTARPFVAKYNTSGMLRWARQVGGTGWYWTVADTEVDGAGHIYMTGAFSSPTATFGDDAHQITLVNRAKPSRPSGDIFVAKFHGDSPIGDPPVEDPPVEPPAVVVLANTAVTLDRPGPSAGTIVSNGTLQFRPGPTDAPSAFTGDLWARQSITIHPGNTIFGTAIAGGLVRVLPGATVTGEIFDYAPVRAEPLPQPVCTADGPGQMVPPAGVLSLTPGDYGQVTVGKGGLLQLHSGAYFLRTLALGQMAKLVVDVTDGPVQLHVVEQLAIGKQVQVTLTPGDADSALLTLTTIQTTRLAIGAAAQVVGTLLAPYAQVRLGPQSQFTGSLIADKVTVQPGAVLRPHGAASGLP